MILINLKFTVQPERADEWMDAVAKYTADVRSEPGNLFFEWYRPVAVSYTHLTLPTICSV